MLAIRCKVTNLFWHRGTANEINYCRLTVWHIHIIRKTKRATLSERNVPKLKRNDSPSQNEAYLWGASRDTPIRPGFARGWGCPIILKTKFRPDQNGTYKNPANPSLYVKRNVYWIVIFETIIKPSSGSTIVVLYSALYLWLNSACCESRKTLSIHIALCLCTRTSEHKF